MNARSLVLTAGFGEGHNAAARALALAWDERHGPGTARLADVFALAAPRANALARRAYLGLINRAPGLWKRVYDWLDRSAALPRMLPAFRAERRTLARLVAEHAPAVIACTYPIYGFWLRRLAAEGRLAAPCFNVVTDSISINSLWWRAGAAGWFLPNEDSAAVLRAAGIAAERLHVLGFPVAAFFQRHARELAPPDLAAGAAPRVLYLVNSGTRCAAETARALLTATPWELTIAVGRNETLRRELERRAPARAAPTTILGWTDDMPRLLMTHHVVVSKAGGATTQEALAARCPMIVSQIVPGQEEGNYELLRRHRIGALAETPAAVVAELRRAFDANGSVWREWRAALAPLSRPNAAGEIVARIDPAARSSALPPESGAPGARPLSCVSP